MSNSIIDQQRDNADFMITAYIRENPIKIANIIQAETEWDERRARCNKEREFLGLKPIESNVEFYKWLYIDHVKKITDEVIETVQLLYGL